MQAAENGMGEEMQSASATSAAGMSNGESEQAHAGNSQNPPALAMEENNNSNEEEKEKEKDEHHAQSNHSDHGCSPTKRTIPPHAKPPPKDIKPLDENELGLPVDDLGLHIERVQIPTGEGDGFDLEFNYLEKKSESDSFFGDYDSAIKPINRIKNRYSNVLPLERTRVKLKSKNTEGSDYINANWVDGLIPGSEKSYISTQGPLQETIEDFWRMVWETNSNVVVMLTREVENDKVKCARYWPSEAGSSFTFEFLRVTLISEENCEDKLVTRKLSLEHLTEVQTRETVHFQYMDWPDHGLPESAAAFRKILHRVDKVRAPQAPIVVHCSAGIGRTGTFCTVHSTLEKLHLHLNEQPDQPPEFNILRTVLKMREQRVGMVQTKEQYIFCYKALLEETQKLELKNQTPC